MAEAIAAPRLGEWMCTFTGKQFWPRDPRPEDICIEDIAHHLAQENRFNGALPRPYSVAQHCVLASYITEVVLQGSFEERKWALLHDASEAYLKDIHRPLKRSLGEPYKYLERKVTAVIAERFRLMGEEPALVKKADDLCLSLERRDLFPASHQQLWKLRGVEALPEDLKIGFIDWRDAEQAFLRRFEELFGERRG